MRAVVQRVTSAHVTVGGHEVGRIGPGLLVFVGVERGDGPADAQYIAGKVGGLRIFQNPTDPGRHLDRSVRDIGGAVLVVSQFTLTADCRKGRRPSLDAAEASERAKPLIDEVLRALRQDGLSVETGEFQAAMQVSLVNDGPVTVLLDSLRRF